MTSSPSPAQTPSAATSVAGNVLSVGNSIGRYFNLTSAIPSVLLVLWTYALLASNAASSRPDLSRLPAAFAFSGEKLAGLVLATIFVGLFLHPLLFGTTRLLEGYWGSSALAASASAVWVNRHRARKRGLNDRVFRYDTRLLSITAAALTEPPDKDELGPTAWRQAMLDEIALLLQTEQGDTLISDVIGKQEALRQREEYPRDDRIMPTPLGNALRSFEDSTGRQYGLDAIVTAPHFILVGNPQHVEYVEDGRQAMDISIRLFLISALGTIEAVALLLTDGPWLLVALAPYALAYLAYRGAVSAARGYGTALATMIDLNRFALYDAMQLRRPKDLAAELRQNELLMGLLKSKNVNVGYRTEVNSAPPSNSLRARGSGRR